MIRQYYFEDNPLMLRQAIDEFEPDAWEVFKERTREAFHNTSLVWAGEAIESTLRDYEPVLIPKEEWNEEHPLYRPKVKWHESLTEHQAEVEARIFDRQAVSAQFLKNTDPWALESVGGMIAGNIIDPINFIPWARLGGTLGRMAKITRVAEEVAPSPSFFGTTVRWAGDAAASETLFQAVKQTARASRGNTVDYVGASIDVAIATMTGGVLGTAPAVKNLKAKYPEGFRFSAIAASVNQMRNDLATKVMGPKPIERPKLSPEAERALLDKQIENYKSETEAKHKTIYGSMEKQAKEVMDKGKKVARDLFEESPEEVQEVVKNALNCIKKNG